MKKVYPGLDVLKFIMAFAVVGIHAGMAKSFGSYQGYVESLLALAVPTFFVISSSLFFRGINTVSLECHYSKISHFTKRLLILYGIWSIIELPFVIPYHKDWFENGYWGG